MGLGEVTVESVRRAVAEFDRLGGDEFRSTYGFGPARKYVLVHEGRAYDSKAIVGVAHGFATGTFWRAADFTGGLASVVRVLQDLGFDVRTAEEHERAGFGEIAGQPAGTRYASREAASRAGVHLPLTESVCGTAAAGAESILVPADQEVDGEIIYAGQGEAGRDQSFKTPANAALLTSRLTGIPVRVLHGMREPGYRYLGLFRVVDAWRDVERKGHKVCQFRLTPVIDADKASSVAPEGTVKPGRRDSTVQRVVRSTVVSRYVKAMYSDTCQACRVRLMVGDRGYSEGAHIRPLGSGHDGPDVPQNVLCLCPNCHVLFDAGALVIDADLTVRVNGVSQGVLAVDEEHGIDVRHLAYHRERYGQQSEAE
ncbi:YDG/SRA domain-containing protein [Actinokineospora fastidiosa]|uniref:YDG domain-containing protein n=1 Tax=Actinokineospora fastidiosa TaxID=1816 RepID=A0A918GNE4_9PSEU|nr:YDG/SRA domain-containing protein [Actinokineospora fastidiosa]GGS48809.1 hypothetical protein GCM10010171_49900 [Actinokineospora fastidiosa]